MLCPLHLPRDTDESHQVCVSARSELGLSLAQTEISNPVWVTFARRFLFSSDSGHAMDSSHTKWNRISFHNLKYMPEEKEITKEDETIDGSLHLLHLHKLCS
jgi:hypothetical protein